MLPSWIHTGADKKGFHGFPFFFHPTEESNLLDVRAFYQGPSWGAHVVVYRNEQVELFRSKRAQSEGYRWIVEKLLKEEKFFLLLLEKWERDQCSYVQWVEALPLAEFNIMHASALQALLRKVITYYRKILAPPFIIEFFRPENDAELQRELREAFGSKVADAFATLTWPVRKSFSTEVQLALLSLAARIQKGSMALSEAAPSLNTLAQKFYWTENNYAIAQRLTPEDFRKKLEVLLNEVPDAIRELERIETQFRETQMRKAELRPRLSERSQRILDEASHWAWWQDQRKATMLVTNYYLDQFLCEACRRQNLPRDTAVYALSTEFSKLMETTDVGWLAQRAHGFTTIFHDDGRVELLNDALPEETFEHLTELSGMPASPGYARGHVKILLKTSDMKKIQKGDIAVASMTRPEFMPVLIRCAGIVTDEGGITCHAAIVARELKIPCLIATRFATRVLKDGDLVELNTDEREVKILQQA